KAEIMDAMKPGMLGSTFGGNVAAVTAALATLDVIEEEGLLERARSLGDAARRRLEALQAKHDAIGDVRGVGAMIALEFVKADGHTPDPATVDAVVRYARDAGLILLSTGTFGNVIRLLPPINLSDAELDEGLSIIEASVTAALALTRSPAEALVSA